MPHAAIGGLRNLLGGGDDAVVGSLEWQLGICVGSVLQDDGAQDMRVWQTNPSLKSLVESRDVAGAAHKAPGIPADPTRSSIISTAVVSLSGGPV